jgi:hypothetical protein
MLTSFDQYLAEKRERHEEFYLEPDEGYGVVVLMWDQKRNDWKELTLSEFVRLAQDLADEVLESANDDRAFWKR